MRLSAGPAHSILLLTASCFEIDSARLASDLYRLVGVCSSSCRKFELAPRPSRCRWAAWRVRHQTCSAVARPAPSDLGRRLRRA